MGAGEGRGGEGVVNPFLVVPSDLAFHRVLQVCLEAPYSFYRSRKSAILRHFSFDTMNNCVAEKVVLKWFVVVLFFVFLFLAYTCVCVGDISWIKMFFP